MTLADRFQGVVFGPQKAMAALAEKPLWIDALIVVLIFIILGAVLAAPYSAQDSLKAMKDNVKLQDRLGKDRYETTIRNMETAEPTAVKVRAAIFATVPFLIGLFISAAVILIMGRLVSTQGAYIPILAVLAQANFIDKIFGGLVRTALVLARKSVFQTSTSLVLFAPKVEFMSTPYILLSQVDFFQIWMFSVVGYGLAAVFKIPIRKAMILSFAFWLVKSMLYVALAFATRSYFG